MKRILVAALLGLFAMDANAAKAIELNSITFPEGRSVDVSLEPQPGASTGRIKTNVTFRDGQSRIVVEYEDLKPAILFAGDVTCYVLWAVSRDAHTENLGEFLVDEPKGRLEFATGKKAFALMVTAEPFYLVSQPSSLVTYASAASRDKRAASTSFVYTGLGPSPNPALDSITNIRWDSKTPLPLLQARKANELATKNDSAAHAAQIYQEAVNALNEANELEQKSPRSRKLIDAARRSVALSNEALNISARRREGIEIEKQINARRAEMESLEQRAAAAEEGADQAERAVAAARADMAQLSEERDRLAKQATELRTESRTLEAGMAALRQEKTRLEREKTELSGRLSSALSHVAETRNSARGFVVNLPDILFDVNQATLKPGAKLVLAKLAGILLVIPDLRVAVEGHTDSTGSAQYNLDLSQRRAESVLEFLSGEGVEPTRLSALGLGMERPIADNETTTGRSKNRRVEIVISEQ